MGWKDIVPAIPVLDVCFTNIGIKRNGKTCRDNMEELTLQCHKLNVQEIIDKFT